MRLQIWIPGAFALALGALGCAGGGVDVTKKQVGELDRQLAKLRADVAILSDRLDLATRHPREAPQEEAQRPQPPSAAAMVDADRPALAVVTLAPEPPAAAPADPKAAAQKGPNPVLRNTFNGGVEARDGVKATVYEDGKKPGGKR